MAVASQILISELNNNSNKKIFFGLLVGDSSVITIGEVADWQVMKNGAIFCEHFS
jgi:hypothetical protein